MLLTAFNLFSLLFTTLQNYILRKCVSSIFDFWNTGVTTEIPMLVYNWVYTTPAMGIGGAIFFGYSSALLGISGFESSSNYVENQKPGVFPKTLRNMWVRFKAKERHANGAL